MVEIVEKAPQVLIVEDRVEVLWMMGNVLEWSNFSVDAVTSGHQAIEKLKEHPEIKVIVLNYLLPDKSGLTVLGHLKRNGCKARVIGVSAFSEIKESFLKEGAFGFLVKPFDIKEFIGLCKQALSANQQSTINNQQSTINNQQSTIQRGGGEQMALMRVFVKVDKEGKIPIPSNIRREAELREGQLVEIKVSGPNRAQFITIHKRKSAR